MKVEVSLTSDEYEALSKAPGRSAPQRLRWLCKFWMAVCEEKARRDETEKKVELSLVTDSPWNGTEHPVDMTDPEVRAVVGLKADP
jgi:hypothetical protein